MFWQALAVGAGRVLTFRARGARRRVSGVRPRVGGVHVIEGTCQNTYGVFRLYTLGAPCGGGTLSIFAAK